MKNIYCVLCILRILEWCMGSRVLVVFPVPRRSHGILGDSIVRTLLDAGYEVTYVTPFPREHTEKLACVDVSATLQGHDEVPLSSLLDGSPSAHDALHQGPDFAQSVLQHEAMQELLQDATETFDVVIADWYFSGLLAPLASLYSCPLIWYSSLELSWQQLQLMHEASTSAYTADVNSYQLPSKPYSAWERVKQIWLQSYHSSWGYYITKYVENPTYHDVYKTAFAIRKRSLPDFESSIYNASLMLVNSHPPLGQGVPTPGNVRLVGGHHVGQPIPPLPQKLKTMLDKVKNGVILFNLGPDFLSKNLPNDLKRQLLKLFEQLEQTVVWQMEQMPDFRPKNVIVLKTVPQLSILNHPNTVMLITTGDALSIIEATYSGVPIVGLPLRGDQFFNVELAAQRGCGLRVDATGEIVRKLYEAINEIFTNSSYRSHAQTSSSLFHRRHPPADMELQHWVQLVISTKGASHLRSPALDLSIIERYNLDVVTVCIMLLWFLSKVAKVLRAHLIEEDYADKKNE